MITVSPGGKHNTVCRAMDGSIRVRVVAPAIDGKANKALIAFLATRLTLPASQVVLVRGERSRRKVFVIEGLSDEEVRLRLGIEFGGGAHVHK